MFQRHAVDENNNGNDEETSKDVFHHFGGATVLHDNNDYAAAAAAAAGNDSRQAVGLNINNNLDLMDFGRTRRSRSSFVDPDSHHRNQLAVALQDEDVTNTTPLTSASALVDYGALVQAMEHQQRQHQQEDNDKDIDDDEYSVSEEVFKDNRRHRHRPPLMQHPSCPAEAPLKRMRQGLQEMVHQVPAIVATLILVLMVAVPFGVAYFPITWGNDIHVENSSSTITSNKEQDEYDVFSGGSFPLPGKESLGIRMALAATCIGQLVMTFASGFENPVAFQLLENVPFYHALAKIVIEKQGYGMPALATLFFLFGLSSVLVGLVFFTLGKMQLGRVAYFFPAHVLVGCIGGIGVFIGLTSIEVTNNHTLTFDAAGWQAFWDKFHLFGLVLALELVLRILSAALVDEKGDPKYRFLVPIYFCSIVPLFYVGMYVLGVTMEEAQQAGYLFPDPSSCGGDDDDDGGTCLSLSFHDRVFNGHVFDVFRIIDFSLISWAAVTKSLGTIAALCTFSLIHVPINIPAFAVSSNVDIDMNKELIAHGFSNMLSGFCGGGLQNVMTYSFSVLFQKSGGGGIPSCLTLTAGIGLLFVYGPAIAVYFPRCMAGTLLLHIGLDLFLEGCYDSWGKFDALEYAGIWVITIVMSIWGMTAALLAGIVSALSTYVVQSITHQDPIFRIMPATTLRSSAWGRPSAAMDILDNAVTGRSRILIVQLQGHLFFGNIADLTDQIKGLLSQKMKTLERPFIVVMDFSLVVGMDSSAAHAIAKLKNLMHRLYHVEVSIFVTGTHRDGFPCNYALSEALTRVEPEQRSSKVEDFNDVASDSSRPSVTPRGSIAVSARSESFRAIRFLRDIPKNRVCHGLDEALVFAEDVLVARVNPAYLQTKGANEHLLDSESKETEMDVERTEEDERALAELFMENIVPMKVTPLVKQSIKGFVSRCVRREFKQGDILWKEGDASHCAMILVSGSVSATLEGTKTREIVERGNIFGELGLVDGTRRFSTVTCTSKRLVVYSLSRDVFDEMVQSNQVEARLLERIAIRYLAHRVQHVSNRIFDTHCLPI